MHSTRELSSDMFRIAADGETADLEELLPGFGARDRLGIVTREPCGALGASALILAAVTAFYDAQRATGEDFFIYPEYFVFHVGGAHGHHGWLEIWPSHKEVEVPDDPEALLEAINDRGVSRLVLPDREPRTPELRRETLASARAGIRSAIAYAADGAVAGGDVDIIGDEVTERYVATVLEQSTAVPADARERVAARRRARLRDGAVPEAYRRIGLDEALALL